MKPKLKLTAACLCVAGAVVNLHGGSLTANFNDGQVPAKTQIYGNAVAESTGGVSDSGVLKLTKAINSQQGSFVIEDLDAGASVYGFKASFMARVGGGTATPADGWSFCFATDLPDGAWGEAGAGTGITVMFDTYDNVDADPNNGTGEAPQISLKIGGQVVATSGLLKLSDMITGSAFVPVHINVNADGSLDLDFNGKVIFSKLYFPNYQALVGARFGFGARTGGANENCFIDDLSITTLLAPAPGFVMQPQNLTVIQGTPATFSIQLNNSEGATIQWLRNGAAIAGATATTYALAATTSGDDGAKFTAKVTLGSTVVTSAEATLKVVTIDLPATPVLAYNFNDGAVPASTAIFGSTTVDLTGGVNNSGVLTLTIAENSLSGSFLIDDPSAGAPVYGIAARFDLRMGGGTEPPADGFSFNFASDLPDTGTEEGGGTGLTVTFDVYDNGGGEAPAFTLKYGGVVLAEKKVPLSAMQTGDGFADIIIRLTTDGLLDLSWNGNVIFDRTPVSAFGSLSGARIGLYGRTGGLNEVHAVDNLRLYTYLTPGTIRITKQPQPTTVLLGKAASFAVEVNNPAATTYQWFKNGTAIGGATQNTYSLATTTAADQGAKFKATVTAGGATVTSDEVALSILDLTAPTNPQLSYDFNNGLPTGAAIAGTALIDPTSGVGGTGVLELTQAQNSQAGGFISDLVAGGAQLLTFTLSVDVLAGGGSSTPADGFSINLGSDVPGTPPGEAENGGGTGLRVAIDTYDNGGGEAPSIDIWYQGAMVVTKKIPLSLVNVADTYFPVLVRVNQNGTLDMTYGDTVIYYNLALPGWVPLNGVKVGLYARTGGLNSNYWFDNLKVGATIPAAVSITIQPSDALVLAGQPATFAVQVSNPVGVTYQWSRDGVAVAGATQSTYTTGPLAATDDGAGFSVKVSGPSNTLTSNTAKAQVLPVFGAGANPPVNFNFDDGQVPGGAAIFGNTLLEDGVVKLTINENSQSGSFLLDTPAGVAPINDFTATWKMRVGGGTDVPADGFSFVLANDVPDGAIFGEDGTGSGLVIAFDIYDNGGGEAPAIDVRYASEQVATKKYPLSVLQTGDAYANIGVRVNRVGTLDLYYGTTAVFRDLPLPGYKPFDAGRFGWGARTGGLNENQWLDSLQISLNTQLPPVDKPVFTGIKKNADGTITLTWTGGGTLQAAASLAPPILWQDVTGATSPYTFTPTSPALFGRIRK